MASLRDTVKDYQDELRDGIAWVAFWKQGRSWNAEYFHLDMDDTLYPEDRSRLEEIKSIDPAAVILNGYYCGHLGEDMSLDELTAGVRYHLSLIHIFSGCKQKDLIGIPWLLAFALRHGVFFLPDNIAP